MIERLNRLKSLTDEHAADVLGSVYNAMLTAQEKAKSGRQKDIKEYVSRKSAFERTIADFERIYDAKSFETLAAVREYLVGEGYKIAERTIYKHRDEGKLKANSTGGFTKVDVDAYAEQHLNKTGAGSLTEQRLRAEVELKEARTKQVQIAIAEQEGRLIERDKVGHEFAARIEEIKRGFEEIESSLPALLVGRDEKEIRTVLKTKHDYLLERYSRELEAVRCL